MPSDFIRKLELEAVGPLLPSWERLFCSIFLLQVYAPLRYADLEVSELFLSEAAVFGVSVGPKSRNREVIRRAAPRKGSTGHTWCGLILEHWESAKPKSDGLGQLYPRAGKNWTANVTRQSTQGGGSGGYYEISDRV